ncbi:NIPSNAP family protein [Ralstonia sp. VS2407]
MIYELREYTFSPENVSNYLALFCEIGMPIRGNDFGRLVGNWMAHGDHPRFLHLWEYASLADRTVKRAALGANQDWATNFLPRAVTFIDRQHLSVVNPIAGKIHSGNSTTVGSTGKALIACRCKPGTSAGIAAQLHAASGSRADGIWIGEFPDPNSVYVIADAADITALGQLEFAGILERTTTILEKGPYQL